MNSVVERREGIKVREPILDTRLSARDVRPWIGWTVSAALGVAILGLGQVSAHNRWVSPLILPAPSDVADALWTGFTDGRYLEHLRSTLVSAMIGFSVASVAAILIAGVLSSFRVVERVFMPYVIAFQSLPKVAIAPVIVIWLGFDDRSKNVIVMIVVFFPVMINALQGFRLRQREFLELMVILGGSRWQLFRQVRLPAAMPFVFAGLHIGVLFALIGAVVAEFIASTSGLGYALIVAQAQFNVAGVFAILVILMVLGMLLHAVMNAIERRVAFWANDVTTVNV